MRRVSSVAGILLLGVAAAGSAQAPLDMAGWKMLREEALGFELKHPPTWRLGRSTGTLESVLLGESAEAGTARVSMQVFVQRGINPGGLPVDRWYDDQLKRFNVTSAPPITSTTIGGRRTIRREMSRPDSRRYDFYTAINASDIFQVSITQPAGEARLDRAHEAVRRPSYSSSEDPARINGDRRGAARRDGVTVRAGSIHLPTDGAVTEGWHTAIAQPEGDIEDDIDVRHVAASVPLATRRL